VVPLRIPIFQPPDPSDPPPTFMKFTRSRSRRNIRWISDIEPKDVSLEKPWLAGGSLFHRRWSGWNDEPERYFWWQWSGLIWDHWIWSRKIEWFFAYTSPGMILLVLHRYPKQKREFNNKTFKRDFIDNIVQNHFIYPLVNKHSYWTCPFIVDLPIKHVDCP